MHLLDLPNEMLQLVCSYLDAQSLSTFGQTCGKILQISDIDILWQTLCMKDFQVNSNKGWSLSYKDVYTKVLSKYKLLGLKRLALMPYGGLVNVCWSDGEIQVNGYTVSGALNEQLDLLCEPYFSVRWSHTSNELQAFCSLSENPMQEATLVPDPQYPLLQCTGCPEPHTRKKRNNRLLEVAFGQSSKPFARGFLDHPSAFLNVDLSKGFNCPLLPMPVAKSEDFSRSPISLGLYSGDYGGHGKEIVCLMMNPNDSYKLEALKILGDPNVPAGYSSLYIYLDRPILLNELDQTSIDQLLEVDASRPDEAFHELLCSDQEMQQPFSIPVDCLEEEPGTNVPNKCLARYLGKGRVARHNYTGPSFSNFHMTKFSDDCFGVLWLELRCFSMFHKVNQSFPISNS